METPSSPDNIKPVAQFWPHEIQQSYPHIGLSRPAILIAPSDDLIVIKV
jgi:hypothetical protein